MAKSKLPVRIGLLLVLALIFWRFPLFRWVPLEQVGAAEEVADSLPPQTASEFWEAELIPAAEKSPELGELLGMLESDDAEARKKHGTTLGIGGATMFLVRASGKVAEVGDEAITIEVEGVDARVELAVGLLFGNLVRDASGLLDVSDYPDSQSFNGISSVLNRIVETEVISKLKEAAESGREIRIFGCFELDEGAAPESISIVPLKIEWP